MLFGKALCRWTGLVYMGHGMSWAAIGIGPRSCVGEEVSSGPVVGVGEGLGWAELKGKEFSRATMGIGPWSCVGEELGWAEPKGKEFS